jgi:hypothetical protein
VSAARCHTLGPEKRPLSTTISPMRHGGDQENWGVRPMGKVVTETTSESPEAQRAGRKVSPHAATAVERQRTLTPIDGVFMQPPNGSRLVGMKRLAIH